MTPKTTTDPLTERVMRDALKLSMRRSLKFLLPPHDAAILRAEAAMAAASHLNAAQELAIRAGRDDIASICAQLAAALPHDGAPLTLTPWDAALAVQGHGEADAAKRAPRRRLKAAGSPGDRLRARLGLRRWSAR